MRSHASPKSHQREVFPGWKISITEASHLWGHVTFLFLVTDDKAHLNHSCGSVELGSTHSKLQFGEGSARMQKKRNHMQEKNNLINEFIMQTQHDYILY
jgi:hypothetical protein